MVPERSIADIDRDIAIAQNFRSRFPRSHHSHILNVHILAKERSARYSLSRQKEDLDRAIVHISKITGPSPSGFRPFLFFCPFEIPSEQLPDNL
jgi:hypothetical protein